MSRVQTSRANKYGPALGTGNRNQQSFLGRMVSGTVSAFNTAAANVLGKIIIGPTPPSIYARLIKEEGEALAWQPNDRLEAIRQMPSTGDGQVTIIQSKATGKRFARKVTHPMPLDEKNSSPWDSGTWKKPNEIHVLEVSRLEDHPHPRILASTVLNSDHPGQKVIWSSFCSGGNLGDQLDFWLLRRHAIVPHQFLLHILVQTFEGLAYLHNGLRYAGGGKYYQDSDHRPIIHGDMKAENIFLRWDSKQNIGGMPDLVIGDFGVSLVEGGFSKGAKVMAGTLCYNAPEIQMIHGHAPVDEEHIHLFFASGAAKTRAADIWAIGTLLYMIASKDRQPWDHRRDVSEMKISKEYDIPVLEKFIAKCLETDPEKRATADYDERTGIMQTVDKFRVLRDEMVAQRGPLDITEWLHPDLVRFCNMDGLCKCSSCERAKGDLNEESRVDSFLDGQAEPMQPSALGVSPSQRSSLSSIDYREED